MAKTSSSAESLEIQLEQLNTKIEHLEEQLADQSVELDTLKARIPDSNIISPKFINRAFTVWGHYVVAGLIIALPFVCLTSLFAVLIAIFSQQ
jgi:hypothetical protein